MRKLIVLTAVATLACLAQQRPADALMEADRAFARDAAAKGLEGWMSWFAEDAQIPARTGMVQGKAALREVYAKMFATPEFHLEWAPVTAEISADGTLGYTFGRAKRAWRDSDGQLKNAESRYVTIWRKQKDGSYKVIFDMGG